MALRDLPGYLYGLPLWPSALILCLFSYLHYKTYLLPLETLPPPPEPLEPPKLPPRLTLEPLELLFIPELLEPPNPLLEPELLGLL